MMKDLRIDRRGLLAGGVAALASPAWAAPSGFDAFVRGQIRAAQIPGAAVGYAKDGAVRMVRGYGLADVERSVPVGPATVFHIASITKTMTAAAVMQLVEAGKIALDDPVADHLDFPLANPRHPDAPISFRHLLTHVSGISDARYYEVDFREFGREARLQLGELLRAYLVPGGAHYSAEACFSSAAPGEAWDYSNIGYGLLGYAAGRIAGRDLREHVRERIFEPLGMRNAGWTQAGAAGVTRATPYDLVEGRLQAVEPVGMPDWPAGAVRASAADMARYLAACSDGGGRILSRQGMAQMLEMQAPPKLPDWLTGQGLGWQASRLEGQVRPNHWGGDPGVFTAAYLDPANRAGVVVLTNSSATAATRNAVKAIAARVLGA